MRANTWHGTKSLQVKEVPDPKILNPRDAIVRITCTAICGSDLHLYNGYMPTMKRGDMLGHEFMGEVVEVGPGVNNLEVGDRVVVPFPIACGHCLSARGDLFACARTPIRTRGWRKRCGDTRPAACSAIRTCSADTRAARRIRARTVCRRRPAQGSRRADRRTGVVSVRYFPDRLHGGGGVPHSARRHRRGLGLRPGRAVRDRERLSAGAERVIAIDRFPYRLQMARERAGAAETINYEEVDVREALDS